MMSHELANELLAMPDREVYFEADDGEQIPIDAIEDEGDIIVLAEGEDEDAAEPEAIDAEFVEVK